MKDRPLNRTSKPLADLIRQRRAQMDVPFARIAERAGISRAGLSQYADYEYEMKRLPAPHILEGLAEALGVSLEVVTDAAMRTVGLTQVSFENDLLSELVACARSLPDADLRDLLRYCKFLSERQT